MIVSCPMTTRQEVLNTAVFSTSLDGYKLDVDETGKLHIFNPGFDNEREISSAPVDFFGDNLGAADVLVLRGIAIGALGLSEPLEDLSYLQDGF